MLLIELNSVDPGSKQINLMIQAVIKISHQFQNQDQLEKFQPQYIFNLFIYYLENKAPKTNKEKLKDIICRAMYKLL